jgi:hypothetical protein
VIIEFAGEAYESFQTALDNIAGYTVEVVDEDGNEFTATVIAPDRGAEYGDTVILRRWMDDDGRNTTEPFSVRVEKLTVL